jgi:hypothetical protein
MKHVGSNSYIYCNQRSPPQFEIPHLPSDNRQLPAMERSHQDTRQLPIQPTGWTNTPASISHLPAELLIIIFKLVYATTSPFYQPISLLASVCTIWRDVMSLLPEFWTDILIHLDSETFSIEDISAHLQWSRSLTIHVSITSKTGIPRSEMKQ